MSGTSRAMVGLTAALLTTTPACRGDDRFIADSTNADDLAHICRRCPMLAACRSYAETAHPASGVWAGRRWEIKQRKVKKS